MITSSKSQLSGAISRFRVPGGFLTWSHVTAMLSTGGGPINGFQVVQAWTRVLSELETCEGVNVIHQLYVFTSLIPFRTLKTSDHRDHKQGYG